MKILIAFLLMVNIAHAEEIDKRTFEAGQIIGSLCAVKIMLELIPTIVKNVDISESLLMSKIDDCVLKERISRGITLK